MSVGVRPRMVIEAYKKQAGVCVYCREGVDEGNATWEHVVPRSWGGAASGPNCVLACEACNRLKSQMESFISHAFSKHEALATRAALFILHCSKRFRRLKVDNKKRSVFWRMRFFWMAHYMLELTEWHLKNQQEIIPEMDAQLRSKFV